MARMPKTADFDRVRVYVVNNDGSLDEDRTQIISKEAYDKDPKGFGSVLEPIPAGSIPKGETA